MRTCTAALLAAGFFATTLFARPAAACEHAIQFQVNEMLQLLVKAERLLDSKPHWAFAKAMTALLDLEDDDLELDSKYKKNRSFINQGPLKLVKKTNKHALVYVDPKNIEDDIGKITSSVNRLKRVSQKRSDKISLLQLDNFILPSIYLLQPVQKETIVSMVASATKDEKNAFQTTTAVLTMLIKQKKIESTASGYILTTWGRESIHAFRKIGSRMKTHSETIEIDNVRLEIFNLQYRNKRLKM